MASPFAVFRRNQKTLLAIVGLMAMISFVFLPMLMQNLGGGGQANPVVITTTKYGSLHASDLQMLVHQHRVTVGFLQQLGMQALDRLPPTLQAQYRPYLEAQTRQRIEQMFGPTTEAQVAENWLLARRGDDLGMVVPDEAVSGFIRDFSENQAAQPVVEQILARQQMSQRQFVEAMKRQLLAMRVRHVFRISLAAVPPEQRWDYFQRLKRQADVELAAIPVANFVDKVADPDEATLRKYFEAHKETLATPDSPEPGFRQPHQADVQFLKAPYEKFLDKKAITDDEIKQYYEANKDQLYRALSTPPGGDAAAKEKSPAAEDKPAEKPAAGKTETKPAEKPAEKPAASKPAEKPSEKPAAKPAEKPAAKPAETKPAAKAQSDNPLRDKSAQPAKAEKSGKAEKSDKSSAVGRSPFRLASYRMDADDAKPAGGAPAAKAETKPTAKPSDKPADKPAAPPAEKPAAQPAPAKTESKPAEKPAAEEKPAAPPAKPQYKPLDEVKDEIRTTLAGQRAITKMMEILSPIQEEMARYNTDRSQYQSDIRAKKNAVPPARLDFDALAQKNGLEAGNTGMVSRWGMQSLPIGATQLVGRQAEVAEVLFSDSTVFRPMISQDLEGNRYVLWKTADEAEHVPQFSDKGVREMVLKHWKLAQARKLAVAEAETLKKKVDEAKGVFKDALKGSNLAIAEPNSFTWMTSGMPASLMQGEQRMTDARISSVDGVRMPGPEFMRAVFTASAGGTAVAMNHPQSEVYLVHVVKFTPSEAVLWDQFIVDDFSKYAAVGRYDTAMVYRSWLDDLKTQAGFKWKIVPDKNQDPSRGAPAPTPDDEPLGF